MLCDHLVGWDGEGGRGQRMEGTHVCLGLTHDDAKTITILHSNDPPIKINQLKEKKKKTGLETTMQAGDCIPGHCSQRNRSLCSHKPCTRMFAAPLFVTDRNWSQPRCFLMVKWLNKQVYPYHGLFTTQS